MDLLLLLLKLAQTLNCAPKSKTKNQEKKKIPFVWPIFNLFIIVGKYAMTSTFREMFICWFCLHFALHCIVSLEFSMFFFLCLFLSIKYVFLIRLVNFYEFDCFANDEVSSYIVSIIALVFLFFFFFFITSIFILKLYYINVFIINMHDCWNSATVFIHQFGLYAAVCRLLTACCTIIPIGWNYLIFPTMQIQ